MAKKVEISLMGAQPTLIHGEEEGQAGAPVGPMRRARHQKRRLPARHQGAPDCKWAVRESRKHIDFGEIGKKKMPRRRRQMFACKRQQSITYMLNDDRPVGSTSPAQCG